MRPYSSKRDNIGLWFALTILFSVFASCFGIWAIVESILYLVKDDPFNFISLWLTVISFVLCMVFFVKLFFSSG